MTKADTIAICAVAAMAVASIGAALVMPPHVVAATVTPSRLKPSHWQFQLCGRFTSDGRIVAGPCNAPPYRG